MIIIKNDKYKYVHLTGSELRDQHGEKIAELKPSAIPQKIREMPDYIEAVIIQSSRVDLAQVMAIPNPGNKVFSINRRFKDEPIGKYLEAKAQRVEYGKSKLKSKKRKAEEIDKPLKKSKVTQEDDRHLKAKLAKLEALVVEKDKQITTLKANNEELSNDNTALKIQSSDLNITKILGQTVNLQNKKLKEEIVSLQAKIADMTKNSHTMKDKLLENSLIINSLQSTLVKQGSHIEMQERVLMAAKRTIDGLTETQKRSEHEGNMMRSHIITVYNELSKFTSQLRNSEMMRSIVNPNTFFNSPVTTQTTSTTSTSGNSLDDPTRPTM